MDVSLWVALILGAVQGLTEFLPVSSTGHLILVSEALQFTGAKASIFQVAVQFGSILAVVVVYFQRFWGLLVPQKGVAFSGWRGIYLLVLTTLPPACVGLLLHSYIKALFTPDSVIMALAVGALLMLFVERMQDQRVPKYTTFDELTPRLALGIGVCQCMALWPGFSRSASTIMGGMLLGARRDLAAEYSFVAAVPLMIAATGYDVLRSWALFSWTDFPFFFVGLVSAFLFAWAAIKTFIALVRRISLRPFAYYRLGLALLVYLLWQ